MLASELSSIGKEIMWTRTLRAEKVSRQISKDSFGGVESLCRSSSRRFLREITCAVASVWATLKQINFTFKKRRLDLRNIIQRKSLKRLVDDVFRGVQLSQDK